jgi:hypothetical protein
MPSPQLTPAIGALVAPNYAELRIGADHQAGYPKPVTVAIDGRRVHVVVEAARQSGQDGLVNVEPDT